MNRFLPHDLGLVERAGPDLCDYVVIAPGLEVVYDFCTRSTLDTDCTGSPQVKARSLGKPMAGSVSTLV